MTRDRCRSLFLLLLSGLLVPPHAASADPWAAPGDARLRHDLQLLSDAGLIKAPLFRSIDSDDGVGEDYSRLLEHATVRVNDIMSAKATAGHLIEGLDGRARAFVEIQNGCDHRCTFCIIPYGRGNSRSVPIQPWSLMKRNV